MADLHALTQRLEAARQAAPTEQALRGVMDKVAQAGAEAARRQQLSVKASLSTESGMTLRFSGKGAHVARDAAQAELARLLPQLSAQLRSDMVKALEGR